ncbi:MAG: amidohydrolase [Burkholderiales bacterium]|nr:amidohydrolase [Burkholderiales bacterium]
MRSPVIDVHTHMLNREWLALLEQHGGPRYTLREVAGGRRAIHLDGAPFMTPVPAMFDYDLRVKNMSRARVDLAVVSLTCPNVYWGDAEVSLAAARLMNDDMAAAKRAYPDRIRWFCSLPWQHAEPALVELARSLAAGASGVMVLANIAGRPLTDAAFQSVWRAIDEAALPVLVHPTAPPGIGEMAMQEFQLTTSIGFTFDTSLAIARCIHDGFLDRYPRLKLIASHGGGALPFLIGRLDTCWEHIPAARAKIAERPSNYARRIYADSVVFRQDALEMAVGVFGPDNVLYGSDYPHNIGDMAGCLARVDALPGDVRARVRGANAREIFGF